MHKKLYNFLGEHNILFNNQFGFLKNNSTSLALIKITEKIKESIDNKNMDVVFLLTCGRLLIQLIILSC